MASIRRPANHDRHFYAQNSSSCLPYGGCRPANSSPGPGLASSSSSAAAAFPVHFFRRLLFRRPSRCRLPQHQHHSHASSSCGKYLFRFLVFFLFGFFVGFFPFADLDDSGLKPHNFIFDPIQPPPYAATTATTTSTTQRDDLPRRDLGSVVRSRGREIEILRSDTITSSLELEAKKDEAVLQDEPPDPFPRKLLIVITPTYNRALQAFYLSRLGHTLRLVPPPLLWIVVEMNSASLETADILMQSGVMYRHLVCNKNLTDIKDRGVHQRNTALEHIELHRLDGIVYFADDDNIYSLELFQRMREIRRFGTWLVAMLAQSKNKAILEGPVCNGSHVIGWHTNEKSKRLRRFHVDMSGFAFNSTIIWDPKRWKRPSWVAIRQLDTVKEGFQETTFIEQLVEDEGQMEGLPNDCSRIMNWHLHLEARDLVYPRGWEVSRSLDSVIPLR